MLARFPTVLLVLALTACSSSEAPSGPVPPAPPPPAAPPGAPPPVPTVAPGQGNPLQALQALGAAAQQMAQGTQANTGPVVNWRELVPFAPDALAGFEAKGEVEGSTTTMPGMGNMEITRIGRSYKAGADTLSLEIVDTSLAPMLRAPFTLVAMMNEDSSSGYKKGHNVKGEPGFAEWRSSGRSEIHVLVAQRFIVNIEVKTKQAGTAERVAEALDLAALRALATKAGGTPAPTGSTPPPVAPP